MTAKANAKVSFRSCAALIVFFALPHLLYKSRYIAFILFCLVGIIVFAVFEEWLLDPLTMAPDDPRRQVSFNGLRWGAVDAGLVSFAVAALKSQLNPHLILNTLNNLYSLALEKSEQTPKVVLMLSNILRYSLYEAEVSAASLEREIEILHSYIALQEIGIGERTDISFEIEGSPGDRQIAPLLLLPIVENAFKHGSAVVQSSPSQISFRLKIDAQSISFEAENPVGERVRKDASDGGIGLDNLRGRLQLLYPHRHRLSIGPGDGIFRVALTVAGEPS